jgi:hypothetical protein
MPIRGCVVFLTVALMAACSQPPMKNVYFTPYALRLEAAPAPAGSFAPTGTVVLYNAQFVSPSTDVAVLRASITPSPPPDTSITWTSSDPSVVVQQQQPNSLAFGPVPTAPPFSTFVGVGKTYGKSTVIAYAGGPVVQSASVAVYHYPSLSLGCRFRYSPAFTFDAVQRPADETSDLYDTMGSDLLGPLDPCVNTVFATAPGTPEVWHAPYGGVQMSVSSLQDFTGIQASQWRDAATQFSPQGGNVLLFKTKGGLIVKALLPVGPFEVSGSDGTFPY